MITAERAVKLLRYSTLGNSLPRAYKPGWAGEGFETKPYGITREEEEYVKKVWEKMPGYTCFYDALLKIAQGKA